MKINGVRHYLWRAVDHEGAVLESFVTKTRDKKAVDDLLSRATPRLTSGPLQPVEDPVTGTIDVVCAMDEAVFSIQGPPGTGKTCVTAWAILSLVRKGYRVGVTSNMHMNKWYITAKRTEERPPLAEQDRHPCDHHLGNQASKQEGLDDLPTFHIDAVGTSRIQHVHTLDGIR